jgi:cytochrome c556
MQRLPKASLLLALAVVAAPAAMADDKDIIEYRKQIMHTLNAQTAVVGQMLSMAVPDDNAVAHLEAIALSAATMKKAFEAKVPGGEAKPAVWANWADFSKRVDAFAANTAAVAKLGQEQGKEAALQNAFDALDCKGCHDLYRDEKK